MKRFLPICLLFLALTACAQATPTLQVPPTAPLQIQAATQIPSTAIPQVQNATSEQTQAVATQQIETPSPAQTQSAATEQIENTTPEQTQSATTVFAAGAKTPTEICAGAVPATTPTTRQFSKADPVLQPGVDYRAVFCTGAGPVYVDLLEKYAPIAVNSFVFLAQQGYYNNTTFHRVIQNFMAQGGDPTATGAGGPGYSFNDEFAGFLNFDKPGWLAMANSGPNTNGSQFFITTAVSSGLDYQYTIFGEVLEGQDNVGKIQLRDPNTATQPGTALNTVVIVTDPLTVKTTYVAPPPATKDDVSKVLAQLNNQLPAAIALNKETSGIFDPAQVAQFAPDAMRTDYGAFLAKYHEDYRATSHVSNAQCDMTTIPYMSLGYTLDHFDTPADATAALQNGFLAQMEKVNGYTETKVDGLDYPLYTQTKTVCNVQATEALTFWQRGHFVATVEAVFPVSSQATPERWLHDLVGMSVYERTFSDVLRAEMR